MVVFASLNRPLTSTTTSSPASDFPPGSQGSKGTLIRVPSCRLLHARSVAAPRPSAFAVVRASPRRRIVFTPVLWWQRLGFNCPSTSPSHFRSSGSCPRVPSCGGVSASRLASRCCGVSRLRPVLWYASGSDASGLAAVSLSAPLAGSMLAVPSVKAGAVSTAGMAPPHSFASAPRAFDFPASVSTPVHTDPFVAFVCPVDLLCRGHVGIIAVGNLGRWLWYD